MQIIELYVPIRSQLAAVIFEKAMRRKNVKAASTSQAKDGRQTEEGAASAGSGSSEAEDAEPGTSDAAASNGSKKDAGDEDNNEDKKGQKSRQAVINLIGVDAKRVSDFSAFQFMIPTSLLQLLISIWFLIYLLGWIPVALGVLSVLLMVPINTVFSKMMYTADQKLMNIRDEKLELVSEALHGIRQVKFSALESQWERRILGLRQKELATIWYYFKANIVLNGCWTAAPIVLALASLSSYAWLHGNLTASVAFVSIGILNTLDFAVSALPGMIRWSIDSWVSFKRIEKYLEGPELKSTRTIRHNMTEIEFQDASLAWPIDGEDDEKGTDDAEVDTVNNDRFVLRHVTLRFPTGELSVISGRTGSGKSLLLAAILGETDVLGGSIYVPAPASVSGVTPADIGESADPSGWIQPTSIAYIGQLPWIENATLRENILFGLPFNKDRYEETLSSCALTKDLEALPDGDKTELGVNGVNLSGGQKWRVTVARAVYSRAGILVMDDIFSAVDAHVSRHILENCLGGRLCQGRTRILVTHHVSLVEKHARFIVELANGTVQSSGRTEELQRNKTLERIKSTEQPAPATDDGGIEAGGDDGTPLKRQNSNAARKFVEDEAREKGSVKGRVYAAYIKDSGGYIYWAVLTLMYVAFQATEIGKFLWSFPPGRGKHFCVILLTLQQPNPGW